MHDEPRVSKEQLQKLSEDAQKRFSDWFLNELAQDPFCEYSHIYLPKDTSGNIYTIENGSLYIVRLFHNERVAYMNDANLSEIILPMFTIGEILTCFETRHPVHADLSYLFAITKLPSPQSILDHLWAMLVLEWEEIPKQFIDELKKIRGDISKISFQEFADAANKFSKEKGISD